MAQSKVKVAFNPQLTASKPVGEFLSRISAFKVTQTNPKCKIEVEDQRYEHDLDREIPPQVYFTFKDGTQWDMKVYSGKVQDIMEALDLKTLAMCNEGKLSMDEYRKMV